VPQTVILIRHAEKPGGDWPGPGLTEEGTDDQESLVVRGWQRAGGLALLLSGSSGALARPDRIYASGVEKRDGTGSRSKRPVQTVTPLGRKLGLLAVDRFSKGQEADLATELLGFGGVTLVSWQHQSIPEVVRNLLGASIAVPTWPDSRFDLIWIVKRLSQSDSWSFSESCQQLLVGDPSSPR
jgi:broad specificity phosphatase PhoE